MSKFLNIDCLKGMAEYEDNYFDLAIVDPPYGIEDWNNRGINKDSMAGKNSGKIKQWDKKPTKEYFDELFRVSKHQIIWGANHFLEYLSNTKSMIIWDKKNVGMHFNNFEMAWTKGIKEACRIYRLSTSENREDRIHPTQKPVALYKWLLRNYAKDGDKILDTHVGSGSSLIACSQMGFDYTGFEIDKDYYDLAVKRIDNETRQYKMVL